MLPLAFGEKHAYLQALSSIVYKAAEEEEQAVI